MPKKITLNLIGLNGNAFSILGAFSKQARKEGWSEEDINHVTTLAKASDYDNLLRVMMQHTQNE